MKNLNKICLGHIIERNKMCKYCQVRESNKRCENYLEVEKPRNYKILSELNRESGDERYA